MTKQPVYLQWIIINDYISKENLEVWNDPKSNGFFIRNRATDSKIYIPFSALEIAIRNNKIDDFMKHKLAQIKTRIDPMPIWLKINDL